MSRAELTRTVGGLRRRMPRHLLPAFCLSLLLLGCACGPAYARSKAPARAVALFAAKETKVPAKVGDEDPKRDVSSFDSPFLVGGNGVLVALAEAQYAGRGKQNTGIVARYIETEGLYWVDRTTENNGTNWKTQLALKKKRGANHSVLRSPTAVIKGDKIYLLALSNRTNDSAQNGNGWHFELSVGAITGQVGSKKIEWNRSKSLRSKLTREVRRKSLKVFPGYDNSAFLTSKGTIVFSANAKNTENTSGFAIMQLKDSEEQWEVSFVENPEECRVFSLFEWKERLVSIVSRCLGGTRYVKEYDEARKEWKDTDDTRFHFLSVPQLGGLTHLTMEGENVLLFSGECDPKDFDDGYCVRELWFSNGNQMHDIGSLETQYGKAASGRFVYTNGELFFLTPQPNRGKYPIVFTRLYSELKLIKRFLYSWIDKNAYLSKPCKETAPKGASPDTLCVTPMPTNGLVSLLSNWNKDTYWVDEYDFINPGLSGGAEVKNGYRFSRAGEGMGWLMQSWYWFSRPDITRYGLTVVATVTVHETPKGDAPLLTVGGDGANERLGLWYKDKQWKVVSTNGKEEPATDLETQKEYRVALILHNNTISAYVNGKPVGVPLPISAPEEKPFNPENVFIGVYNHDSWIHMTVTNVFLYNRVLHDTELEATSRTIAMATSNVSAKTPKRPKYGNRLWRRIRKPF